MSSNKPTTSNTKSIYTKALFISITTISAALLYAYKKRVNKLKKQQHQQQKQKLLKKQQQQQQAYNSSNSDSDSDNDDDNEIIRSRNNLSDSDIDYNTTSYIVELHQLSNSDMIENMTYSVVQNIIKPIKYKFNNIFSSITNIFKPKIHTINDIQYGDDNNNNDKQLLLQNSRDNELHYSDTLNTTQSV